MKKIAREVEGRNQLRAEVSLPLVSIPEEVEKIYKAELWQDFRDWSGRHSDLHERIGAEELERDRRARHDPAWVPRGLLNGAGAYGSRVQDKMYKIWQEERKRTA